MGEFPKDWAAPGGAMRLLDDAPLYFTLADPAEAGVTLPVDAAEASVPVLSQRRVGPLPLMRYWSVFAAAAAGWATLAIAYCPWHLMPQSLYELGVVLFGAAAGGSGALAVTLHPEQHHP